MNPEHDCGAPREEGAAKLVTETDISIDEPYDAEARDALWGRLVDCPAAALPYAATAWALGRLEAVDQQRIALDEAGWAVANAATSVLRGPRFDEVRTRRVVDHQPCRTKCDRCSRCIHSRAWFARGGRPYLGAAAEAALAGAA